VAGYGGIPRGNSKAGHTNSHRAMNADYGLCNENPGLKLHIVAVVFVGLKPYA
jgi:hypothetical protein